MPELSRKGDRMRKESPMTQNRRPRYEDQIRHKDGYSPSASVGIESVPEGLFPPPEPSQSQPSGDNAAPSTND